MCSGSWRICRSIGRDSAAERGCRSRPICTAAASNRALYRNGPLAAPSPQIEQSRSIRRCKENPLPIDDQTSTERGSSVRSNLFVVHRGLRRRLIRSPETIAERREHCQTLRNQGKVLAGRRDGGGGRSLL